MAYGPFSPLYPGLVPGMPPTMAPAPPPFPIMPWPMGFNVAGSFGVSPYPPGHPHLSPMVNFETKDTNQSYKQDSSDLKDAPGLEAVGAHLERQRPPMYNGQWMMPPPQPHPYYPFGFPQFPGFAAPAGMPGAIMPPHGFAMHQKPPSSAAKIGQPATTQHGSSASAASATSFAASSKPPISSIRPSDITRKQVEVLRGSLRYLEDQLQYNKHQIDEKAMESQAQVVSQQIQHFERNLEAQLEFEKNHYPSSSSKDDTTSSDSYGGSLKSKPAFNRETNHLSTKLKSRSEPRDGASQNLPDKSFTKSTEPLLPCSANGTTKSSLNSSLKKAAADSIRDTQPFKKPNVLPFAAALAPPFKPRCESTSPAEDMENYFPQAYQDSMGEMSHLSIGYKNGRSLGSSRQGPIDIERPNTPYLIGQIPQGVDPKSIEDADYTYMRELTEDELRARHMYWGRAPRHLQKGLPKFDGKDFYPPSPVKMSGSTDTDTTSTSYSITTGDTRVRYTVNMPDVEADPFQFVTQPGRLVSRDGPGKSTQSESLLRPGESESSDAPIPIPRSGSYVAQVSRNYDNFRKALSASTQPSTSGDSKGKQSSDEEDDDKTLLFKGRKALARNATKTHNQIWHSMLKKSNTSSTAIPGAVSSMTAQGVLPHYSGHATASLAPSATNPTSQATSLKTSEVVAEEAPAANMEKRSENMPPGDSSKMNTHYKGGRSHSRRG
ncbi:hypothetical protein B0I35DRAFT_231660 [Stachybotrys elegans]|uniref:Uncharacterized protein n=1 Tax=Stachybotrys elegans TaxID=80388 RepID=A0A8K0SRX8_9HYPO|nr:hypothetical protein B0I35DRAFT_231660 [Stachybotrys elegans]